MKTDKLLKNGSDSNIKNPSHYESGKKRVMSFDYELDSALAVGDKILGAKLPKNCTLIDAKLIASDMGATGIFALGILSDAGEDYGLIPNADAGGQRVNERDGADSTLIGSYLGAEDNQLIVECTEATVAATGRIQAFVTVVVE